MIKDCTNCKKTMKVQPHRFERTKFCSRICQYIKKIVICLICKKEFITKPHQQRKYCSRKCSYGRITKLPRQLKIDVMKNKINNNSKKNENGCLIWNRSLNHRGYGQLYFNGKQQQVHRVVYQLYNGDIPEGLMVLHECDVRNCVNYRHLKVGTAYDNTQDMMRKNRYNHNKKVYRGEENASSKLTEQKVKEIKIRLKNGEYQWKIGKEFNVSQSVISAINTGKTWSHVKIDEKSDSSNDSDTHSHDIDT